MISLDASAKIDRRYSSRFPDRHFWLRPATLEERLSLAQAAPSGAALCIAIARRGDDYFAVPFWSLSSDVADATEGAAAEVITVAVRALQAGNLAMIAPMRSGR